MPPGGLNLRRFLSSSSLYAIGDLLTKSARFILIPYYVYVLSKTEIGTLGVLQAISIASWTLFAFGFGLAVPRFYFEYKGQADRLVVSMWWARMGIMLAPCGLLIGLSYVAAPSFMPHIPVYLIAMTMFSGFLRAGFNIIESWYMIREQPVRYRTFTLLQFVTTTSLIIYLVSIRQLGVAGVVIGEVISYVVWTLVSALLLRSAGLPSFRAVAWRQVLGYCSSLIPHTFSMWAIAFSDRVVLQQFISLNELGTYELAYTLASMLSVAALAMRAAWQPSFFRLASAGKGRQEYAQTASYFFSIAFFVAATLVTFAPEAIWLVTRGGYEDAVLVMRIIVVGLVGQAMFMAFNQPLLYERKNFLLSVASLTAMAINIGLNLWWIPRLGILGAAISVVVTYTVLAAFAFVWMCRYYRVRWQWETLLGGGLAATAVGLLGCVLPVLSPAATLCTKALLLAALLGILVTLLWRQRESHRKPANRPLLCNARQPSMGTDDHDNVPLIEPIRQ